MPLLISMVEVTRILAEISAPDIDRDIFVE